MFHSFNGDDQSNTLEFHKIAYVALDPWYNTSKSYGNLVLDN